MRRWFRPIVCILFHGNYHIEKLVPVDAIGGTVAYRLSTLCKKCDADVLRLLERL